MAKTYSSHFTAFLPARSTVQVARLPRDARVVIALTAVRAAAQANHPLPDQVNKK
jgi:enamine deaminase RidA (YjgF/YER057c/UK114 family)